jgi:hypothetical protein
MAMAGLLQLLVDMLDPDESVEKEEKSRAEL